MSFDFTLLETKKLSEEGVDVIVRHPLTQEPITYGDDKKPVTIRVRGQDSVVYQEIRQKITARRLSRMTTLAGTANVEAERAKMSVQEGLDITVSCTVGWEGVGLDGKTLPFSPDNAKLLYSRVGWIQDLVERSIMDRAVFLGNGSSSSS